jgi:LPXTG-site transpeptidase (sortase) family protein
MTARLPRHASVDPPRRGPVATTVAVVGELLLTAGILTLLYVAYILWGTGIQTARAQDDLREQIETEWTQPGSGGAPLAVEPEEITLGDAYAILRIPGLGDDWEKIVVQGVKLSDLSRGPGHYEETADPGELGNFSIAAHRAGHGAPFANLDDLEIGDTIEVETANGIWTYTIDTAPRIVEPSDTWVVDPVPGEGSDAEPTERRMTLTTCHPRYGSSQRMYVSGVLSAGEEI